MLLHCDSSVVGTRALLYLVTFAAIQKCLSKKKWEARAQCEAVCRQEPSFWLSPNSKSLLYSYNHFNIAFHNLCCVAYIRTTLILLKENV
jgi:hypothetical protein